MCVQDAANQIVSWVEEGGGRVVSVSHGGTRKKFGGMKQYDAYTIDKVCVCVSQYQYVALCIVTPHSFIHSFVDSPI